jgi:oxygen-independent coproporphyrinogen-3 oxidase
MDLMAQHIPNYNVDLIYGRPGQTVEQFEVDLKILLKRRVPHISLYTLIYASGTPIGRAHIRGKILSPEDEILYDMYLMACKHLNEAGYNHEEVSNWSLPEHSCRHNWLYWQDCSFIAAGVGAHGYDKNSATGNRYETDAHLNRYLKSDNASQVYLTQDRDIESWLTEYVGCSLRSELGTDLTYIQKNSGYKFTADAKITYGIKEKLIEVGDDGIVLLDKKEWFRETSWASALLDCFKAPTNP